MRTIIIGLVIIFSNAFLILKAQGIKQYVKEHIAEIESIDPLHADDSDLYIIGAAIGEARIVMLGEQDHGDAAAFLAKSRLVKYLHERKGFTVLAFEDDFFSTNYYWAQVKSGVMFPTKFMKATISPIWSYCHSNNYLFYDYIPKMLNTLNPLEIAGFDYYIGRPGDVEVLDSVWRSYNLPITKHANYHSQVIPALLYGVMKNDSMKVKAVAYLEIIRAELQLRLPPNDFWMVVTNNFLKYKINSDMRGKDFFKYMNSRDEQMAINLKWLLETKYPNQKIIVWAHNYHIAKFVGNYADEFANQNNPMGNILAQDTFFRNQIYVLGFTSRQGKAGRLGEKIYNISKPRKESFENWINKDFHFAFIDFEQWNSSGGETDIGFYMSGATLGNNKYHYNYMASWNRVFDGVFYIRDMYTCDRNWTP